MAEGGDGFEKIVGEISGEPMLGPRQADLVDAVSFRVASGTPLSQWDFLTLRDMAQILGLTERANTAGRDKPQDPPGAIPLPTGD